MRKIYLALIGLLCACSSNNDKKAAVSSTKQLITGRWQLDSIDLNNKDSSDLDIVIAYLIDDDHYKHVQFLFGDGWLTEYDADDSISGPFKWQGDSAIELSDAVPPETLRIKSLNAKDLVFATEDSVLLYFKRLEK